MMFNPLPALLLLIGAHLTTAHFAMTYPEWRGDSFKTQWTYPCGGVDTTATTNRTLWPLNGGAIAFKPSHPWAQTYINLGLGAAVTRLNITLVPTFNQTLNGTFCLPTVQLPTGVEVKEGDKATIQVVQLTTSGGALYNCADIEFSSKAVAPANDVCFNSTGVGAAPLNYGGIASATSDKAPAAPGKTNGAGNVIPGMSLVAAGVVAALMV
ncbi:hypothetical protein FPQ18DRAFT_316023 [Pyronema domesticum]|uniref:Similar to Uncharacterized protein AFUA_6G02800 acc. no. Q4WCX9 n=1 Tax=Pyronema omphalodes (strain CBS 100304) TaxID=1076935 RepID=U4LFD9_PYROM|nr:hypothetical protein FPQ18DRAFT_316023 [Pyronema domesticum]CCX10217.1 Similar to Uncharacterized protein AFUA_6G02800; acc. no. Q4WCX9 [Pyronema omphalodes CBS 100304]